MDVKDRLLSSQMGGKVVVVNKELCRKHTISEQTFYNWKAKYGELEGFEAKRFAGWKASKPSD